MYHLVFVVALLCMVLVYHCLYVVEQQQAAAFGLIASILLVLVVCAIVTYRFLDFVFQIAHKLFLVLLRLPEVYKLFNRNGAYRKEKTYVMIKYQVIIPFIKRLEIGFYYLPSSFCFLQLFFFVIISILV